MGAPNRGPVLGKKIFFRLAVWLGPAALALASPLFSAALASPEEAQEAPAHPHEPSLSPAVWGSQWPAFATGEALPPLLTDRGGPPSAPAAGEGLPVDLNCAFLADTAQPLPPLSQLDAAAHDRPVPRQLHQIWFGAPHPIFAERMQSWQAWGDIFGYTYKLWGSKDLDQLLPLMPAANAQALAFSLHQRDFRAASDLVRLTVLELLGGIYLDSDLQPPSDEEGFFDLDRWIPMRGFTALSENEARQTGEVGTFLTNCLLAAPAEHPLTVHLVDAVAKNHHAWCSRRPPIAAYATGPFPLTRALGTAVNVLPMDEAYAWRLFGHLRRRDRWAWPAPGCPLSSWAGESRLEASTAATATDAATTAVVAETAAIKTSFVAAAPGLAPTMAAMAVTAATTAASAHPLAPDLDCRAVASRAMTHWWREGQLDHGLLGSAASARARTRCADRQRQPVFSNDDVALWATPRAFFIWPPGDAPPYPSVPPGRRYAGGPDRAHPRETATGQPIPALLHLVAIGQPADDERIKAWSSYAEAYTFTLRIWGRQDLSELRLGAAEALAGAVADALEGAAGPEVLSAAARGLGLAALASEGGVLVGLTLTPPGLDLRRLVPWRNAAILAAAHSPSYRGLAADSRRQDPQSSEVLFDSGRGGALGSNATAVYPDFLAAARGHRWVVDLAGSAAVNFGAAARGELAWSLVLGEAALSRSLGGAVSLIPMRMAQHVGLVSEAEMRHR